MKICIPFFAAVVLALFSANVSATTHYVDVNSASASPPYTNWATAATVIQDAIDASTDGDLVLVTNGNYTAGGYAIYGSLMNRVVINKAITVQSVNGPSATTVFGFFFIGNSAVRCVYMTNNSALIGFRVTQGATRNAGDSLREESGGGIWCEDSSATISNCVIDMNTAYLSGGGVVNGTLNDCTITRNTASKSSNLLGTGGGAFNSTLNRCMVSGNSSIRGAGVSYGTLNFCTISNNAATAGSGSYTSTGGGGLLAGIANNCIIIHNSAYIGAGFYGLGTPDGVLNNCLVVSNFVNYPGGGNGGTFDGTMNNCTIIGNSGGQSAGALFGTLNNCIVYDNSGSNFSGGVLNNCCTTPMPTNGVGNFTNVPLFVSPASRDFHLNAASPCINAGDNSFVTSAADLDGNPRVIGGTVDIGAYEFQSPIHYVNVSNTAPVSPFTNWITAATNIQDAIDAAVDGDLVLVTNGVYATGGRVVDGSMTNRVVVDKAVTVQSVNGAAATVIQGNRPFGNNAVRCVYLTNNAVLIGFTLTNGATRSAGDTLRELSGGGAWCMTTNSVLIGCLVVSNTAYITGGGSFGGTLTNCFVIKNAAAFTGGGGISSFISSGPRTQNCVANNCIISNNSGNSSGGGAYYAILNDCTIIGNSVTFGDFYGGGANNCTLVNCTVSGNVGGRGGGLAFVTASGCLITNNLGITGGGTYNSSLNNCWIVSNLASNNLFNSGGGGGAFLGNLTNCMVIGNVSTFSGGGVAAGVTTIGPGLTLDHCVLSNNTAIQGGGSYSATLNYCLVVSNRASSAGGALYGLLNGCIVAGNISTNDGGGADFCTLNNSLLFGNRARTGGDAAGFSVLNNCTVVGHTNSPAVTNCILQNCILYYNTAGNYSKSTNRYCCTTPLPTGTQNGGGNFTNAPLFVDLVSADYHLQSNSPCINSGNNSYATNSADLDGNPRISGGTVDIGAYEFQSPSSILSYAWAQQFGLPTDGSADFSDSDGDGLNNWQEWIAGTVPTNSLSVLTMFSPSNNVSGLKVSWQSVSGKNYFLQRGTDLTAQPAFSALQSNIVGQAGTTVYTDATATNAVCYFYRVGVQ